MLKLVPSGQKIVAAIMHAPFKIPWHLGHAISNVALNNITALKIDLSLNSNLNVYLRFDLYSCPYFCLVYTTAPATSNDRYVAGVSPTHDAKGRSSGWKQEIREFLTGPILELQLMLV